MHERFGARRKVVCAVLVTGLLVSGANAKVLYYDETNDHLGAVALSGLGRTTTTVTSDAAFRTQLAGGPWELVLIEKYNNSLTLELCTDLGNYIAGGGRAILSYWGMSESTGGAAALRSAFGVAFAVDQATPRPVYRWVPSSPVFTTPHLLDDIPTDGTNLWVVDNGDRLEPTPQATAVAGFTSTYGTAQSAIVVANAGRTIVNGFLLDNMDPTKAVQLLQNEITAVPEPGAGLLLALAVLGLSRARRSRAEPLR